MLQTKPTRLKYIGRSTFVVETVSNVCVAMLASKTHGGTRIRTHQNADICAGSRQSQDYTSNDHGVHVWSSSTQSRGGREDQSRDDVEPFRVVILIDLSKREYSDDATNHEAVICD